MSFTSIVKNELSKLEIEKLEATTLLSSILKNNAEISDKNISVLTVQFFETFRRP